MSGTCGHVMVSMGTKVFWSVKNYYLDDVDGEGFEVRPDGGVVLNHRCPDDNLTLVIRWRGPQGGHARLGLIDGVSHGILNGSKCSLSIMIHRKIEELLQVGLQSSQWSWRFCYRQWSRCRWSCRVGPRNGPGWGIPWRGSYCRCASESLYIEETQWDEQFLRLWNDESLPLTEEGVPRVPLGELFTVPWSIQRL